MWRDPKLYYSSLGRVECGSYKRLDGFGGANISLFYEVGQCACDLHLGGGKSTKIIVHSPC